MANPITWRNVQSRNDGVAAELLKGAGESLKTGIASFESTIKDQVKLRDDNYNIGAERNTNAFLDKLNSYKTVEEFQAAQADGSLDALKASFGAQADLDVIRGAVANRETALRDQLISKQDFALGQAKRTADPIAEEYKRLKLSGDDKGAEAYRAANEDTLRAAGYGSGLEQFSIQTDANEQTALTQKENRLEKEAIDKSKRQMAQLTQEAVGKFDTDAEARAWVELQAREMGIRPEVLQSAEYGLGNVQNVFAQANGLTIDQLTEYNSVAGAANTAAEQQVNALEQELAIAQDNFNRDETFDITVNPPRDLGAVTNEASEILGYDKTNWTGDDLAPMINKSVQEFIAGVGEQPEVKVDRRGRQVGDANPVKYDVPNVSPGEAAAIAAQALKRMGAPDDGPLDDNFQPDRFKAYLRQVYGEHLQRQQNINQFNRLKTTTQGQIDAVRNNAAATISAKMTELREQTLKLRNR